MIMKITGPTESDKKTPSPSPAMNDVSMQMSLIRFLPEDQTGQESKENLPKGRD
jgi:hypothetical protein